MLVPQCAEHRLGGIEDYSDEIFPMRRGFSYLLFIVLFSIIAVVRFYPQLKHWFPTARRIERSISPVAAPGSAPIEGPYFSDGDHIADRVVAAINHTQKSLDLAIYDLTQPDIATALEAAHRRGVTIRIVADEGQSREPHSEIAYLRSRGIRLRLSRGFRGNRSIMHNKFAVFDARLAETGSFNWTTSADGFNYENAMFLSDPAVVASFEKEFERIWSQAQE